MQEVILVPSKETRSETMETKAECRGNSKNGEVSSDTKTF